MYDLKRVMEDVEKIIAGKPKGWAYSNEVFGTNDHLAVEACWYVDAHGVPLCLVGQWLIKCANVDPDSIDEDLNGETARVTVPRVLAEPISEDALNYLHVLQDKQDAGYTWEDAAKEARKVELG